MNDKTDNAKSLSQFNKEIVRRYIKAREQADLIALNALMEESFINHSPPLPSSKEEMLRFAVEHRDQFPTGKYTFQTLVAEDDLVFGYGNYRGTHDGKPFMDIPASGMEVNFDFSILLRLTNGKIIERWAMANDVVGMLIPLGFKLVPPK